MKVEAEHVQSKSFKYIKPVQNDETLIEPEPPHKEYVDYECKFYGE